MNGKYGIYDREKNDSVTAMDMDYIEYSRYFQLLLPGKMTIFASGYVLFLQQQRKPKGLTLLTEYQP